MSSPIDVCNQAMAHIGDRRISRLDEEAQITDPLVRYCAEFYDISRRQVMASHRWSFAKAAAVLSRRVGVVSFGYDYVHVLPSDRIRIMTLYRGVLLDGATEPTFTTRTIDRFKIVGPDVWSDDMYVGLEYVKDVVDPSLWTPHFTAAVARLMAHYLAGAIGDDPRIASGQLDIYERVALPNAQFYDAVQDSSGENFRDNRADSPTLLARRSSYVPGWEEPDI